MNIYIYSYINKINGHRYIGKTNNIERRKREHKSNAYNNKSEYYNCLWPMKIRQYGYENFSFEILEITDDEHWQQREQYWISYYNTYKGPGYNTTPGGDDGYMDPLLTEVENNNIIHLLKETSKTQEQIAQQFGISSTLISNINQGKKYIQDDIVYPIRKNYKHGISDYPNLLFLLKNTILTFKEIALQLKVAESTIKKINYGKIWRDNNLQYPIRQFDSRIVSPLQRELIYSEKSLEELAKEHNKTLKYVDEINKGIRDFNSLLNNLYQYPLRKPVSTRPEA